MRNMTFEELHMVYRKGRLPCGHGSGYTPGPDSGICQNISCPKCGLRLNIANGMEFGQVLWEPKGYKPPIVESKPSIWQRLRNAVARLIAI